MKNLVFPKLPDAGGGGVGDRDFWLSGVWDLRGCVPEPATAAGGSGGWSPGPEKLVQEGREFFLWLSLEPGGRGIKKTKNFMF